MITSEIKSLLKLNPKSDEAKMKDLVEKLCYEEIIVRDEIQHLVKKNTRNMDLEVQNYLDILKKHKKIETIAIFETFLTQEKYCTQWRINNLNDTTQFSEDIMEIYM